MIKKLNEYLSRPSNAVLPEEQDWQAVEEKLDLQFPQDFKDFINTYGSGEIGNQLRFFSPKVNPVTQKSILLEKIINNAKSDQEFIEKYPNNHSEIPFDIYPKKPGLITVCSDSVGNRFCFQTDENPDNWKLVYLFNKSEKNFVYNGSLTDYLVAMYENTLSPEYHCEYYDELQNKENRFFKTIDWK
jgi:cell wall assembly regulator SMI1